MRKRTQQAEDFPEQRTPSSRPAATPGRASTESARAASSRRRQRKVEEKRRAITEAALDQFSRFGLHGTSLDQIATLADVSKTNLLYYFSNKEDLYVKVLHEHLTWWLVPLEGFSDEQDPQQVVGDYIRRKLEASRDQPQASRLFCLEMIQGAPLLSPILVSELNDLVRRKATVIRNWVERGAMAPVDPYHFIFALWATTQHYADFAVQVEAVTGRTLQDADFFEETVQNVQRIVLHGALANTPVGPAMLDQAGAG
ncbi:HTH-type transcriptional regulator RutR [Corticibacter populi]|uniref:HTH-type transcriptional regulator RutR n=1 Tax=Corticibacter populi TaxID=1550736 RepID=A0A3M6QRA6_9BURK|nr:HTH-type transcriptional regulator RutR [Corticibacter populi]RMX04932.1 HTH-type transcriptional regulator RutR [Corticibacter populi]RZS33643.1 TetR family transcriptional regulator [Corticibacter populi]